jgi:hypothetical protein
VLHPVLVVALGKSSRAWAPRLSLRLPAESTSRPPAIRLSNSSVSIRSVFQISERSVTLMSSEAAPDVAHQLRRLHRALAGAEHRAVVLHDLLHGPRSSAVGVPPLACGTRSSREMRLLDPHVGGQLGLLLEPDRQYRRSADAAARPNTTRSISELEPSRLAPCTDAQPLRPPPSGPARRSGSPPLG